MENNIVIISDTTAITNLYKIGKPQHIKWLFANIIIPKSVLSELLELEKNGRNIDEIKKADWITVASVNDTDLLAQLLTELDLGEAESIALAKEKSADYLIIDEKKGRNIANSLNIKTIGIVGILIQLKHQKKIPAIKPDLELLREKAGFWLNEKLYRIILASENE